MSHSQTFELTLFPGRHRDSVLQLLDRYGITDFVESAGEANADDADWMAAYTNFEVWSLGDDAPLVVYRSSREDLMAFIEALHLEHKGEVRVVEKLIANTLWQEAWEPGFESLETERFFISSPEVEYSGGKPRVLLKNAPVFGSGQHATTQALVRLLEQDDGQNKSLLDIGTGTGVLCLVARYLGYGEVCGTDIEDSAVENSLENAAINDLVAIEWILGSLPKVERRWDVIVCNILPPTLTDLIAEMDLRLERDGVIYLAGFHEANSEGVKQRLLELGYSVQEEIAVRNWLAWKCSRSSKAL